MLIGQTTGPSTGKGQDQMGSKLTYKISQSLTEKKKKPEHTLSKTYLYVTKHQFDDWNKGIFNSLEKKIHTPGFRNLSLRAYTTKKIQKTNSLKRNKQKLKKLNWKQKVIIPILVNLYVKPLIF